MASPTILTLQADIIAIILSMVMFDSFYDFANQPLRHITNVLHKLDWSRIYEFDEEPNESVRERFNNFIGTCVELDIVPAKFYISCKRLFHVERVPESLSILQEQAPIHMPSRFSYLVFKSIFRPFLTKDTAKEMSEIVKNPALRMQIPYLIKLLQGFYDVEEDKLMPRRKLCPNARDSVSFNCNDWPPTCKDVWYSLCNKTVDEVYLEDDAILAKPLTIDHILHSSCPHCSLQIILFKILHGGYLYY